ncbi:MAG: hypothetical protein CFH15_01646 [Alphaproteobacteria bacterium MarineAlpha5_Bin5]|nr:MAG: hypothetical protein CFH15_01646 [Alphaproteobacteria bacterium MarineAlpha5_Bin5]|tara:strand:+ start:2815 stop:3138 length:324 start_codon:yes stop_codon:yes gene_type:complete
MNNFDDRKKAFEAKFIQDEELNFKLRARRNKLVGEWAADKINKSGDEDYIKAVRESDLEKPGDDDIIDKIFNDFQELNLNITREDIIKKLQESESEVKKQLFQESVS